MSARGYALHSVPTSPAFFSSSKKVNFPPSVLQCVITKKHVNLEREVLLIFFYNNVTENSDFAHSPMKVIFHMQKPLFFKQYSKGPAICHAEHLVKNCVIRFLCRSTPFIQREDVCLEGLTARFSPVYYHVLCATCKFYGTFARANDLLSYNSYQWLYEIIYQYYY